MAAIERGKLDGEGVRAFRPSGFASPKLEFIDRKSVLAVKTRNRFFKDGKIL